MTRDIAAALMDSNWWAEIDRGLRALAGMRSEDVYISGSGGRT